MPRPKNPIPTYGHHKASGRAFVVLEGRTRTYLGRYGSAESKAEYARQLAALRNRQTVAARSPLARLQALRFHQLRRVVFRLGRRAVAVERAVGGVVEQVDHLGRRVRAVAGAGYQHAVQGPKRVNAAFTRFGPSPRSVSFTRP